VRPPMQLGDALDLEDFRTAAHTLLTRRTESVRHFQEQGATTSRLRAEYEKVKSTRYIEIKHKGGEDKGVVSAAEAGERVKGDGAVQVALIARDTSEELLRARREDIAGCDEALSTLRRIADWSMQLEARGV